MSANKKLVETYLTYRARIADRSKIGPLLADDVEWVEWADGVPASGSRTRGKAAVLQNLGEHDLRIEIIRMTEENNVVVAEGTVRVPRKEGGEMVLQVCNIYEIENDKMKRMQSFLAMIGDST
jgi:ketosteroid isomerase-like protein